MLGFVGLVTRRNLFFILLSLEVMLNAAGLAFVVAGAHWGQADGQVMFIFMLTMAAAEVSVALALLLQLNWNFESLSVDSAHELHG